MKKKNLTLMLSFPEPQKRKQFEQIIKLIKKKRRRREEKIYMRMEKKRGEDNGLGIEKEREEKER
jgi:hypothetical protein